MKNVLNAKRFSYVLLALVLLLTLSVIGLAVAGNAIFQNQSDKLTNLKAQNQAVKEQEISLAQAKKDIEKYEELDKIAKSVVPKDKDQAKTIREINTIAAESGITLQQVSFSNSTLGQAPPPTSSGSSEDADKPKAPATSPSAITQVKPVAGINGVYSLEIIIKAGSENNTIPYYKFLNFLERLESNRRTAHVGAISLIPDEFGSGLTFTLTLNAYLKP